MVVSDHYTPLSIRTHSSEPPPFAWGDRGDLEASNGTRGFTEANAAASGLYFEKGHEVMTAFLQR